MNTIGILDEIKQTIPENIYLRLSNSLKTDFDSQNEYNDKLKCGFYKVNYLVPSITYDYSDPDLIEGEYPDPAIQICHSSEIIMLDDELYQAMQNRINRIGYTNIGMDKLSMYDKLINQPWISRNVCVSVHPVITKIELIWKCKTENGIRPSE